MQKMNPQIPLASWKKRSIMKKCFIWSAICICLMLITDHSTFAQAQQEFIDNNYGYSIKHPSSWKAAIYRSGIVVANINSPDNKSGLKSEFSIQKNQSKDSSMITNMISKNLWARDYLIREKIHMDLSKAIGWHSNQIGAGNNISWRVISFRQAIPEYLYFNLVYHLIKEILVKWSWIQ